ncbi:MAG: hypothetical protein RJA36_1857 [Pseudomonadota bacterium]|jgi:hypothetical protein
MKTLLTAALIALPLVLAPAAHAKKGFGGGRLTVPTLPTSAPAAATTPAPAPQR